jgi:hypothetical protein
MSVGKGSDGIVTEEALWPDLPLAAWSDTCNTLHLWTQIVGKVRIALTPLINHWWNATLLVTARGRAFCASHALCRANIRYHL